MIEYILGSSAWSLGGLCIGFFLGRITRDVVAEERTQSMPRKMLTKYYDLLLGLFVLLLCLGFLYSSIQGQANTRKQNDCLVNQFKELSVALDARAELTGRETTQNKKLWLIYAQAAGLINKQDRDHPDKALTPEQTKKLNTELVDQLLEYKREITRIEQDRKDNPVPPYPAGRCSADD